MQNENLFKNNRNNQQNKRARSQPNDRKRVNKQNKRINRKINKMNKNVNNNLNKINNLLSKLNIPQLQMNYNKGNLTQAKWNHIREPGLKKVINNYHDNSLAEYVYGITHPDVVYRDNLNIKCPSIMPIPTSNFAFKETFTLNPNESGNFLMVWNPNYLGSSDAIVDFVKKSGGEATDWIDNAYGLFSNLYWTNNGSLSGNNIAEGLRAQVFKRVVQPFNKYRLTSACIKVMYTGPVLDQSGTMSACASFMEFPRTMLAVKNDTPQPSTYWINQFPQIAKLGDFDTIRQGQWSRTVNLVNDPKGITCVYIPTDSLSQAFVDNGDTITAKNINGFLTTSQIMRGIQWNSRAANITFPICGSGIKRGTADVITVECYYNYEIIVHEEQLPFFRPTINNLPQKKVEEATKAVNQIASNSGTIVRTQTHDWSGIMNSIRTAISSAWNVFYPIVKLGTSIL